MSAPAAVVGPTVTDAVRMVKGMTLAEMFAYATEKAQSRWPYDTGIKVAKSEDRIGAVTMGGDVDLIERWMQWKSGQKVVARAQEKLENASKRRQKGANLTVQDIAELIALARIGEEPR